jgi:hypothetical protein
VPHTELARPKTKSYSALRSRANAGLIQCCLRRLPTPRVTPKEFCGFPCSPAGARPCDEGKNHQLLKHLCADYRSAQPQDFVQQRKRDGVFWTCGVIVGIHQDVCVHKEPIVHGVRRGTWAPGNPSCTLCAFWRWRGSWLVHNRGGF